MDVQLAYDLAQNLPANLVTGHREIDLQHAAILVELQRMRSIEQDGVWASVAFLKEHVASHFVFEELLMDEVSYVDQASHRQEHVRFLDEFGLLKTQLEQRGATRESVGALVGALETWVGRHVLGQDVRLATFIRAKEAER